MILYQLINIACVMKFLSFTLINLFTFSFAELDIFNKCPDFHPIKVDVETVIIEK